MNEKNALNSLSPEDRPYEKCEQNGAGSLTDRELLAVLLRTGTRGCSALELADKILNPAFLQHGILSVHHWNMQQLLKINGIGRVKAIQILCLSELAKRLSKATASVRLDFTMPSTIAEYYMEEMRHKPQENLKLVLLNGRSQLIGSSDISKGTVNSSLVSPRELFIEALQKNAVYIVLLHNHPSGDPTPSKEDILISRRIGAAGILIGIKLVDHIIIGDNCYKSLYEEGFIK
ncbi:MAG: DNA repair protein RadC [Hespellia sp.]|nr:DNA repair protein RadC [Hespellia sp.]